MTPLHHAAVNGCVQVTEKLIIAGAYINAVDNVSYMYCQLLYGANVTAICYYTVHCKLFKVERFFHKVEKFCSFRGSISNHESFPVK